MPPKKDGKTRPLDDAQIQLLEAWIVAGAAWPTDRILDPYEVTTDDRAGYDWWSYQPVRRPEIPRVEAVERVANPIDAFILARLEQSTMQPAPRADRRTLIRRVYFDLVGFPPTMEEVSAFVADASPEAYPNLVDRLLASPQYGERWARYWLDVVRFAETNGYERDAVKPFAWKYRDWVIRSLNEDKSYDRFVTEQLAGDELPDRSAETAIATGMLRVGTWDDEPNDPLEYKYERLEDLVHTTTTAFLGVTAKCARCHDHKFDPIPQTDYHRLAGLFWAGFIDPRDSKLMGGPSYDELGFQDVFGWTDRGREVPSLHLLKSGNPHNLGPAVTPGFLRLASALEPTTSPPPPGSKTTQRRLQWARWITDRRNPLPARVMVNRLWLHHFGAGLVRTPSNFGFKGDPPTHPQLLDWLAAEFMDGDWRIKRMHRHMLLSNTYRQASVHPEQAAYSERDYGNRQWWRANRRRLDAEAMRDAMLHVSDRISLTQGGPSFYPRMASDALEGLSRKQAAWTASTARERERRSIYMFTKRSLLLPLMTTFDFCDTTAPCGQRDVTTVAPQALALMNNAFTHEMSASLARRVTREVGTDRERQVIRAWEIAFNRAPTQAERDAALVHLTEQHRHFDAARNEPSYERSMVTDDLVLWLKADADLEVDEQGRVRAWRDQSGRSHHTEQSDATRRPQLVADVINGRPAVRFDGKRSFLHVAGQVLASQRFTILAVVNDTAGAGGHREIFSNWNREKNTTTSVFLGTTGPDTIRFTDNFAGAGRLTPPTDHGVLTAIADDHDAVVYRNADRLGAKGQPLATRTLDTPYVVGQQGDITGEYWHGDIAELIVYNRALAESERIAVWNYLFDRYGIERVTVDPEHLALASLCHVLLNANEFVYVD
jgi:hypothetical protein